jgi:hypothetical protein
VYRSEYEITGSTRDLLAKAARTALAPFRTIAGIQAEMEEAAGGGSSRMQEDSTEHEAAQGGGGAAAAPAGTESDITQPAVVLVDNNASTASMPDLLPDPQGGAEGSAMSVDGGASGIPLSNSAVDVGSAADVPAGSEATAAQPTSDTTGAASEAPAAELSPEKPADAARAAGEAAIARAAAAAGTSSGGGAQQDAGGAAEYGPPAVAPFDMFAMQQAPPPVGVVLLRV